MAVSFQFIKEERLSNKQIINHLFSNGERLFEFPFMVIWETNEKSNVPIKIAISVPKRKIQKATSRNFIKRQIRESYRKLKLPLSQKLAASACSLNVLLVYNSSDIFSSPEIDDKISVTLQRLSEKV